MAEFLIIFEFRRRLVQYNLQHIKYHRNEQQFWFWFFHFHACLPQVEMVGGNCFWNILRPTCLLTSKMSFNKSDSAASGAFLSIPYFIVWYWLIFRPLWFRFFFGSAFPLFLLVSGGGSTLGCVQTNRVKSSPIQSNQTLESRGVHTDRVESSQVSASPSGFLVLFEQCTSKELYSDGKF